VIHLRKVNIEVDTRLHEKEVSTSELAAIVGKTKQGINQLTRNGELKQTGATRGRYSLGEAVQAYIEHISRGVTDGERVSYPEEKAQHERIKKEISAIELAKMRGEVHASEDIETVMNDMLMAFRQKILTIPTKLAPQLTGIHETGSIKVMLTTALHEALSELSKYDPGMFSDEEAEKGFT
jgi:phage terminase Nu1 subunit (DNA packaging protein)